MISTIIMLSQYVPVLQNNKIKKLLKNHHLYVLCKLMKNLVQDLANKIIHQLQKNFQKVMKNKIYQMMIQIYLMIDMKIVLTKNLEINVKLIQNQVILKKINLIKRFFERSRTRQLNSKRENLKIKYNFMNFFNIKYVYIFIYKL